MQIAEHTQVFRFESALVMPNCPSRRSTTCTRQCTSRSPLSTLSCLARAADASPSRSPSAIRCRSRWPRAVQSAAEGRRALSPGQRSEGGGTAPIWQARDRSEQWGGGGRTMRLMPLSPMERTVTSAASSRSLRADHCASKCETSSIKDCMRRGSSDASRGVERHRLGTSSLEQRRRPPPPSRLRSELGEPRTAARLVLARAHTQARARAPSLLRLCWDVQVGGVDVRRFGWERARRARFTLSALSGTSPPRSRARGPSRGRCSTSSALAAAAEGAAAGVLAPIHGETTYLTN